MFIKMRKWPLIDRVLLGTAVVLLVLVLAPRANAQCDDPCEWVQGGGCNCIYDRSYYGAMVVQCCCGWWICWQGVTIEGECSPNCNDDEFHCIQWIPECAA